MRRQPIAFLCWCVVVLFFSACSKEEEAPQNVVFDLEEEFLLELREALSPTEERDLLLGIKSVQEFDCENYELNSSVNLTNDEFIRVTVTDLIQPDDCVPGQSPALGQAQVGPLNEKEYLLNFSIVHQISNAGQLIVHPDYYRLSFNESVNGVSVAQPTLRRIPQQSVWGYLDYDARDLLVAENLLRDMEELLEFTYATPGNYGYFTLSDSNQVILTSETPTTLTRQTFLLQLRGTVDELQDKVEEVYCPQYRDKIELKIYTSTGAVITCS
ncbi:MAG: hypothetical protein AAFW73_10730 [Bacteroidota bacterium]